MKYPVYVISKGRAEIPWTANFLKRDGVPFRIVVEPQEADAYRATVGEEYVLETPFSNLGLGGIPSRNFCWEHSKAAGHDRHWILDDNVLWVSRRFKHKRVQVEAGLAFDAAESFVDRYTNIAIAGFNYEMFAIDGAKMPPFYLNCHVYSCLLIQNSLEQRWRGRYNEDTDLCLQVLAAGLCTVLFNAFLIKKPWTGKTPGGNMTELYQGDGRLKMARSLQRMWPYVVETKRRFNRPQHVVRDAWRKFDTPLIRRTDIDWKQLEGNNEFGMVLSQVKPQIKSAHIQSLVNEYGKRGS